jgi:hypothetical protein
MQLSVWIISADDIEASYRLWEIHCGNILSFLKSIHHTQARLRSLLHQVDGLEDGDLVRLDDVPVHDHLVEDKVRLLEVEHDLKYAHGNVSPTRPKATE